MDLKIQKIKRLYHGTEMPHKWIDLQKSNPYNDFGAGYYLTSYFSQAASWAKNKCLSGNVCYIYEYELLSVPDDLRIQEFLHYDEAWLNYITKNRAKNRVYGRGDNLDIVYDRMADNFHDQLIKAINDYSLGKISPQRALNIIQFTIKSGKRDQYCFKTEKAIRLLKRVHCYQSPKSGKWQRLY